MRTLLRLAALTALLATAAAARAQQPFFTDDADVTERGRLHFEFADEFDLLPTEARPALRQNTATFTLAYGLPRDAEVSVSAPAITIFNAAGTTPRRAAGVGDLSLAVKYNFLKEREGSRRPALAASFTVEAPTGDAGRGLGSGLYDYGLNGILQKSLTRRTTLRLNGGVVFAGNNATGALGIRERGTVWTAGGSLVREFTPRLQLGAEVTGAVTSQLSLSRGQLQAQAGGNYALTDRLSLDFGLLAGRFAASPRLGAQVGVSVDF